MQLIGFLKRINFSIFLSITLLSKIGSKIYLLGMPWLVYDLTGSAIGMGIMFFAETLPYIFMAPIAGHLVDNLSTKLLMSISSLVEASCVVAIPILHVFSVLNVTEVYILGFILSCASATYMVLNDTILPQLFTNDSLEKANSIIQLIDTGTMLLGASIGGVLISVFGVFGLFWVIMVAYAVISPLALVLNLSRHHSSENHPPPNSLRQFIDSFRYVIKHSSIRPLVILNLLANITAATVDSLLIFFLRHQLHLTSTKVGLTYGVGGVAEVLGAIIAPVLARRRLSVGTIMIICQLVYAFGVMWMAFSLGWITVGVGIMIQSIPVVIYNIFSRSMRQRVVPSNMLGRVNGIFLMLGQAAYPAAGFASSAVAQFAGVRNVFIVVAWFTVFVSLIYWFSPFRKNQFVNSGRSTMT